MFVKFIIVPLCVMVGSNSSSRREKNDYVQMFTPRDVDQTPATSTEPHYLCLLLQHGTEAQLSIRLEFGASSTQVMIFQQCPGDWWEIKW